MITEAKIQQDCVRWFRNTYCLKHHSPRYCIFSVPNEGKDPREQANKIATGLLRGASDFIVLLPKRALFFETKTEDGTQKPEQKDFEETVTALGFEYYIIRSFDQFELQVTQILKEIK